MFVGRLSEQRAITELVDAVDEAGGTLLVVGEPGIGKSTLLGRGRRHAVRSGLRVLSTTGTPADVRLPYAGLRHLLLPLEDHMETLTGEQRSAIRAAFGGRETVVADRYLVTLTVAALLMAAAATAPLLVVVDDAHWLDPDTAEVLGLLARRLRHEPVVMLVALRDGYDMALLDAGLPELRLAGLDDRSAGEVVDAHAPQLGPSVRRQVLEVSRGNPLALSELAISAWRSGTPAHSPPSAVPTLSSRVEAAFAERWSEFPARTRTVLLVAALNEGGALDETLTAAGHLARRRIEAGALTPAVTARLVAVEHGRLRFRHPLVRSAIEQRADADAVRAGHRALARVLVGLPDRRAWHRAAAAQGPDEKVAAELEAAAGRAERQAAITSAVAALERAAELSQDPAARNRRLMRAAQLSSDLGRPDQAQRIIGGIAATDLDVVTRAHMARLEEALDVHLGAGPERVRHLVELAQQAAAAGESDLGMELLLCAARRCWWTDPGRELRLTVARTALSLPAQEPLQPLLQAVLAFAAPDAYEGVVRERLTAFSRDHSLEAGQLTRLGIAGAVVGDFALARTMFAAAVPQLRSAGRLSLLARALHHDAYCAIHTGDWDGAAAAAHEVEELAAEFGQRRWIALAKVPQAWVAALRGQTDSVARLAAAAEHVLAPVKSGDALAFLQLARGLAALGEGDYGRAYGHLRRLFDPADSAYHHLLKYQALADFAAAAAHSGHRDDARAVVAGLADWATEDPSSLPAVNLAAATMLLADDADVEDLFRAALSGGLRAWPWHHACLELEYGGWLRRSRRAADSRGHLTTARDAFALLGAPSWRDRAQRELRASGVRPSGAASRNAEQTLTAQEREIAGFVVEGLSNRQIGERLHLSHRTVATHLYRMFPKLGITSRAELSGVLGGRTTADAATADTATADTDARRTAPRRLPPAPGHFTGRDGELRAATAWLEAAGQPGARHAAVATVSGMAGVGKTALAVQWAHRLTGRYPDGQLATDLRGFGDGDALDPRDALEAFLVALGVQRRDIPVALADRTAMFRDRTAGLRVLVLLDNARDAAQVRPLLPASPTALTLVTSRNRLTGLAVSEGAASFTLEPWNTPEAVAALASRIGPARLGEEAAAAAGLVALCGGLPLAVALVAARLQGNEELPVAVALAELQEGAHTLDAFTDQDRGVDLRTVFSWSYRELSPEAARLFRLLSLHPGSEINADEAAALIAEPLPSTRALLRELGGAHLIRETPKGLYTFHVLLRVYAGELARARDTEHARAAAYHRLTSRPLQ